MPLRSVEAASRDDAIAAAREQFGPSARVVGVRRVRSGGVLGFFATERYVAEVAADPFARLEVSSVDGSTPSATETTGGFASSPLSAAAAATAAPSPAGSGRAAAPARNGAAAYAAAAGQASPDRPLTSRGSPRPLEPLTRPAEPARPIAREDDRVSELAGLFADAPAEPQVPLYGPGSAACGPVSRAAAPLAPRGGSDAALPRADVDAPRPSTSRIGLAAALDPDTFTPDAPSPFTAALARMAAGDRDVRDAVEEVLDQPRVVRGRSDAGSWPSRSGTRRPEDTSAPSGTTRQEEEPVGDQVVAPPSIHAPHSQERPNWAAEPAPIMGSPREEAIAEVLRSALAQGHSDEALAGILRKMLAGASPQTALADPTASSLFQATAAVPATPPAPPAPAAPDAPPLTMSLAMALANAGSAVPPAEAAAPVPVLSAAAPEVLADPEPSMFGATTEATTEAAIDVAPGTESVPADGPTDAPDTLSAAVAAADVEPGYEMTGCEMTGYEMPDYDVPAYETAASEPPAYRVPSYRTPAYESPLFDSPLFSRPASDNSSMWGPSVASIWGEPTSSHVPLWGEPAPFGHVSYQADLPIWDDVLSGSRSERVESPASDTVESSPATDAVPAPTAAPAAAPKAIEVPLAPEADGCADARADEVAAADDDVLDSALPELEVAVLAPVFARTASDPAPLSLEATSVMPPLALLPPLPGSRVGRGRPPVPPASPRSSSRTSSFSAPRTSSAEAFPTGPDRDVPARTEPAAPVTEEPRTEPTAVDAVERTTTETGGAAEQSVDNAATRATEKRTQRPADSPLATVTQLRVTPPADHPATPEIDLFEPLEASAAPASTEPAPQPAIQPEAPPGAAGTIAATLTALGLPSTVLGADFANDVDTIGTYAALTRALALGLPAVPELPTGAGEVLFVVGPGVETLRAARTLAAGLRLDPESVQWATRGDLAGLAPRDSRMTTVDVARQRRQSTLDAGTVTIVAVDIPMRTDAYWMAQLLAIWSPVAVWAVVEATRKPEDVDPWLAGLTTVDALIVSDTDVSGEPAAALRRAGTPVAVVDGVRATPHRWASLLCERLETGRA